MEKDKKNNNEQEEDIVIEEEGSDEPVKFGASDSKLRARLKDCESERKEYLDGWQRMRADYANLKKKFEEERFKQRLLGKEEVIEEFLPAVDSFEMAFKGESWEKVDAGWRTGIEYIYSQLISALESVGVVQINPAGETFDPNVHTSVDSVLAKEKGKDGVVAEVVQKGYRSDDKIIRSPKVKVYTYDENL